MCGAAGVCTHRHGTNYLADRSMHALRFIDSVKSPGKITESDMCSLICLTLGGEAVCTADRLSWSVMSATLARAIAIFCPYKKMRKNHWIPWSCPGSSSQLQLTTSSWAYCKSRLFRMYVIFVYFVRGGFCTKIKCMRKVQRKSENPQESATVWKFHAYERSESPGYENWVRTKYSGFTVIKFALISKVACMS